MSFSSSRTRASPPCNREKLKGNARTLSDVQDRTPAETAGKPRDLKFGAKRGPPCSSERCTAGTRMPVNVPRPAPDSVRQRHDLDFADADPAARIVLLEREVSLFVSLGE